MPKYVSYLKAAELLLEVNRVLVIGCSGGGKTTLSVQLANRLSLEYISIDRDVRWLPNWTERDKRQQRKMITEMVNRDRWLMDGSGASTFDLRLPRTDLILWVRVTRYTALKGLTLRVIRNLGSVRPEMAEGCPEKLPDLEFLSYIWNFEKKHTPIFIEIIDKHGSDIPIAVLQSHAEIGKLLSSTSLT